MPHPIVFIVRNRIKQGSEKEFREFYRDSIPRIEASKPDTLVQLAYIDKAAAEVVILRLFPNSEAMDLHLQGADERSKAAYQFIEPTTIEIYGEPGNFALEIMNKVAVSGIKISILPQYMGGFIRPKTG